MPEQSVGIDISPETIGQLLSQKGYRVPLSQRCEVSSLVFLAEPWKVIIQGMHLR